MPFQRLVRTQHDSQVVFSDLGRVVEGVNVYGGSVRTGRRQSTGQALRQFSHHLFKFNGLDMTRVAKATLAASCILSVAIIWGVHYQQNQEREVRAT